MPVMSGEVAGLLASYREARATAERVRRGLTQRTRAEQLPEVVASVDADGRPVVYVDRSGLRVSGEGGPGATA
jgi:hypothetical protein